MTQISISAKTYGVLAVTVACFIWGLSPLYYDLLSHIPTTEVLAHRTLWSFVLFAFIIGFSQRRVTFSRSLCDKKLMGLLCVAGLMIAINWFLFIRSVGIGRVTESSLGYYIYPFFMVFIGRFFFKEHILPQQKLAVVLAFVAVLILLVGGGIVPWLAIAIAASFAIYAALKRCVTVDPIVSVTIEVLILLPAALLYLAYFGHITSLFEMLLLIFSGVITAGPLILLSYAAQRITMASVGVIQYTNPSLQFLSAIVILGEPFTFWHAVTFLLIWTALILYSLSALKKERNVAAT